MKRAAIIFLILLLSIAVTVSCSPSKEPPPADNNNQSAAQNDPSVQPEAEAEQVGDDLPPDLDYGGYTFGIYTRENTAYYNYIVEEEDGEILNDSIYQRARNVEARLNIIFKETTYTDNNAPRNLLMSGDTTYDIYNTRCSHALNYWLEGFTVEIDDLPRINLNKPYWNKTANESISLNNRHHVAIGASNLTVYEFTRVLLFNKQLISDFNLQSPYELVNSGQWTVDKMDEMMKMSVSDLNGDGVFDINDRYGYAGRNADVLPAFWIASGVLSVTKDQDDIPFFSAGDEKFISIFNKTFEILVDTNARFKDPSEDTNVPSNTIKLFTENHSLFMDCQVSYIKDLRGMETDFGVIPYPKYDEQQQNYFARGAFYDAFIVGQSNPDLDRTSAVIEALNSESYKTVIPAYYELCLKTRNSRDNESEEMLDLIFDNLTMDLGDSIWVDKIRDAVFSGMFSSNNRNISSRLAAMERSIQADIDKILNLE